MSDPVNAPPAAQENPLMSRAKPAAIFYPLQLMPLGIAARRKRNERTVRRQVIRDGSHCRAIGAEKGVAALVYPHRWDVYIEGSKVLTFRGHKRQMRAKAWMRAARRGVIRG
jgi:hypothetical protein